MHKTSVQTESRHKGLATVESTEDKQYVDMYVREATDCAITGEAQIRMSSEGFYDLVVPILQDHGYTVAEIKEAF